MRMSLKQHLYLLALEALMKKHIGDIEDDAGALSIRAVYIAEDMLEGYRRKEEFNDASN